MNAEQAKELWSHLDKMKVAMLCTMHKDGHMHSRPMHHVDQKKDFDGTIYFYTAIDSDKVEDIKTDPHVCLNYADHPREDYMCVTGKTSVTQDKSLIEKFWSPMNKAFFDGPDDPRLCMLAIEVETAELWDTASNRMVQFFEFMKASLTNGKPDVGEYKKLA